MLLNKIDKIILGEFLDKEGNVYKLVREIKHPRWSREQEREQILFCRGNHPIEAWDVSRIKLDLLQSEDEAVKTFLYDYLKYFTAIKECLQNSLVQSTVVLDLWKNQPELRETIVKFQNISDVPAIVQELDENLQWIFFTQNFFRTKEGMTYYKESIQELFAQLLFQNLSTEQIAKHEGLYSEWRSLIAKTYRDFFTEQDKQDMLELAKQKTHAEINELRTKISNLEERLKKLDQDYEAGSITEKILIQEDVQETLATIRKLRAIEEDVQIKLLRIESYFKEKSSNKSSLQQ